MQSCRRKINLDTRDVSCYLIPMQTIILDGKEIKTGVPLQGVRFSCVFAARLVLSFKQGIKLDEQRNVFCSHCGQRVHETNVKEILSQL